MKPFFTLLATLALLASCNKETPATCTDDILNQDEVYTDCGGPCAACPIEYPEYGPNGMNLLYGQDDTLNLISSTYSLKATVPPGSTFKTVFTSVSGDLWVYGLNNGWSISPLTNMQTFEVESAGTAQLILNLSNTSGSAKIEFFENGDQVTNEKVIVWG